MKNLLLLEEDVEGREALARILKRKGFRVLQAGDEMTALTAVSSALPLDLVVAGATSRDRSEFLSDLRGVRPLLPVMFLADYCDPEARLRSIRFGPFTQSRKLNFYINVRPIRVTELDRMIRIIVHKQNAVQAQRFAAA